MAESQTDEEDDVALVPRAPSTMPPPLARRKAPPEKLAVVPRLEAVSQTMLVTSFLKHSELGRNVHIWPCNLAIRDVRVGGTMEMLTESRNLTPTCHMEVREEKKVDFDPGHDEKEGMAFAAYDIARLLIEDRKAAVIVASIKGMDAPSFLVALAVGALNRLDKTAKKHVLGGKRGMRLRNPDLKRLANKFSSWSEVVGRHAINSGVA